MAEENVCRSCQGSGKCASCDGTGQQRISGSDLHRGEVTGSQAPASRSCSKCMGTGTCQACLGSGVAA